MRPSPSVRSDEEFDVENAEYVSEVLVSDVLTTQVGKQSMRVNFNQFFLKIFLLIIFYY